jgi:MerR family transcriptional regulator/heat shock protein HspR
MKQWRSRRVVEKSGGTVADRQPGVFAISVAADMVSMQVQNLRVYERHGLVEPERTVGGTRLYNQADLDRLVRIRDLLAEGLNLAGIARVIALESEVDRLQVVNRQLRRRHRQTE